MQTLNPSHVEVAQLLQAHLSKFAKVSSSKDEFLLKSIEEYQSQIDVIDIRVMLQVMAGVLVETALFFEEPDETLQTSFQKLSCLLNTDAYEGPIPHWVPFDAPMIDRHTEYGRGLARLAIGDWSDCEFAFHDMLLTVSHHMLIAWEEEGIPRNETFRLLIEYATRCLSFEISAQELCDVLIEKKIARDQWTLGDCLGGLAAAAGWRLAKYNLLQEKQDISDMPLIPVDLDPLIHVMTAEAVRMGVPAGSDWRFGLAANDVPPNPPMALLQGVEPYSQLFFSAIPMKDLRDQAVACAKAAGRMLAVAACGDRPEIAPVIAKPLAMAAITETYQAFLKDF
jgi:hypothetical protein